MVYADAQIAQMAFEIEINYLTLGRLRDCAVSFCISTLYAKTQ